MGWEKPHLLVISLNFYLILTRSVPTDRQSMRTYYVSLPSVIDEQVQDYFTIHAFNLKFFFV